MYYRRVCEGLKDIGEFFPANQTLNAIKNQQKDYYHSIYMYTDTQVKEAETTITLGGKQRRRGIAGMSDVVTDCLLFDFDSTDLNKAKEDASSLTKRLIEKGFARDSIGVYTSGNKGFHVSVNLKDKLLTPSQFKSITIALAGDLESFDTVINDPSRLIRMPYTKHPVSGLYKIPLTIEELDGTVEEIKEIASHEYTPEALEVSSFFPPELLSLLNPIEQQTSKDVDVEVHELDMSKRPAYLSPWKYALLNGYFPKGTRNYAGMIMAATLQAQGFAREITGRMIKGAMELQQKRFGGDPIEKEEVWAIVDKIYSPLWKGGTYSEDNFPEPIKKFFLEQGIARESKKEGNTKVITMAEIGDDFTNYIHSFEANSLRFGLKKLDEMFPMPAGSNIAIIGAASSGKSAMALKLLENASSTNMTSVFASLDMSKSRMFEKMLYRVTGGMDRKLLFEKWKDKRGKEELLELVNQHFGSVYMFNKSAPTVESIRSYIEMVQDKTGKPCDLVMIDYFERVMSDFSDDTKASKMVASGIQDIVNDMPNIRAITLVQPNKFSLGGGPDSPILSYTSIKGSSFLYQSYRQILSLWRPFFTPQTKEFDKYMEMAILKNDLGELDTFQFGWKGKTGETYELSDIERQELEELLKMKNSKGSKVDDDL